VTRDRGLAGTPSTMSAQAGPGAKRVRFPRRTSWELGFDVARILPSCCRATRDPFTAATRTMGARSHGWPFNAAVLHAVSTRGRWTGGMDIRKRARRLDAEGAGARPAARFGSAKELAEALDDACGRRAPRNRPLRVTPRARATMLGETLVDSHVVVFFGLGMSSRVARRGVRTRRESKEARDFRRGWRVVVVVEARCALRMC